MHEHKQILQQQQHEQRGNPASIDYLVDTSSILLSAIGAFLSLLIFQHYSKKALQAFGIKHAVTQNFQKKCTIAEKRMCPRFESITRTVAQFSFLHPR